MSEEDKAVWDSHDAYVRDLVEKRVILIVGPTEGSAFGGMAIFEAPDKDAARKIMKSDPAISSGLAVGDLRRYRGALPA